MNTLIDPERPGSTKAPLLIFTLKPDPQPP